MQFYVEMLDTIYEMNNRNARLKLREDLFRVGFFEHKQNEIYWKLLEEKGANVKQAEDFAKAVMLYNHMKLYKGVTH